jgi:hypothetical protein
MRGSRVKPAHDEQLNQINGMRRSPRFRFAKQLTRCCLTRNTSHMVVKK